MVATDGRALCGLWQVVGGAIEMKHLGILALLLTAMAEPASGQSAAQTLFGSAANPKWGPNGNGTLKHEDDLQWLIFHDARITADRAAGIYSASFSPILLKMEGQRIAITGYILPVQASSASMHFVLTRRSAGCPFCPPNEPTEAIEVFSQKFIKTTQAPITVEGKLHFVSRSEQGLFFRIDGAKIW
ncbi:DUF3299 domain-containing protein [Sphingomonas sp. UYP23]